MTNCRVAPGPASPVVWRVSRWDRRLHAFRALGEVYSQAVCTHNARTRRLAKQIDGARTCYACALIVGDELTEEVGDRDIWAGPR